MDEQHKGMCSVPKLALDVMACEVVRLLQLTKSSVVPLSYRVPRKVIYPCLYHLFWKWGERQVSGTFSNPNCPSESQPALASTISKEKLATQPKKVENVYCQD